MKVAIIGTAPGSRAVAPFNDPEWKIWGCSQGNQGVLPRIDVWFELHALSALTGEELRAWAVPYLGWLRAQTFPVYMQEKNDYVPGAIVFPYRRMIELFGDRWFTSTVAWMQAYAIHQMREGDEIGLFGVDMAAGVEHYTAQRAGCVRFIEIAREKGIIVTIPHESCLGQPAPLYGYCEATNMGRRLYRSLHDMETRRAEMAAQRDKLALEIAFADGMMEQVKYDIRTFLPGPLAGEIDDRPAPAAAPPEGVRTGDFEARPSGLLAPKKPNGTAKESRP